MTCTGAHHGAFRGIPPTGGRLAVRSVELDWIVGGKVAESWVGSDRLGLLHQLGVIPESLRATR